MMPWGFGFSSTLAGVSDHQTPSEQQVSLEATFVVWLFGFFLPTKPIVEGGGGWHEPLSVALANSCFPSVISVKDWD